MQVAKDVNNLPSCPDTKAAYRQLKLLAENKVRETTGSPGTNIRTDYSVPPLTLENISHYSIQSNALNFIVFIF